MWRRVSCEQPLNTSQSILRLRGSLDQSREKIYLSLYPDHCRKGIWSIFQNLVAEPFGSRTRRGNATRPGDARRSSGKSCLFCISHRGPGILSQGEWVLVYWPRVPQFSRHPRAPGGTLKILGRLRRTRTSSYPYPQQVSKVNSLWSIE